MLKKWKITGIQTPRQWQGPAGERGDDRRSLPFITSGLAPLAQFQHCSHRENGVARSTWDIQRSDPPGRTLMEGGQVLCGGWFVCAPFEVKGWAYKIAEDDTNMYAFSRVIDC